MARIGRPPSCECGACGKCKRRIAARIRYQGLTAEQKCALIARRDPEKVKAADVARYRRDWDKRRAAMDEYQAPHVAEVIEIKARWNARNPEKRKAHAAVSNAIRDGRLVRQGCEREGPTCSGDIQAHHEDYTKYLEVTWLCVAHHAQLHVERRAA